MTKSENFRSLDALVPVAKVINEAGEAVKDKGRTIVDSPIPDVLVGAVGAGAGGALSFAALYSLGTVGLSAAGITSGLAAAGGIIGGGMVAGVFALAAPIAVLGMGGVLIAGAVKGLHLDQEKERLLQQAIQKHHAIVAALREEVGATQERADYLASLNVLLQSAIVNLREDLAEPDSPGADE